ncbi:hypothetical protein BO78DRAFT_398973 [Aspergillus sclerotiicarbonarius CBS 121057]|uniref:N-acetyltransferase domain-containing protein n=1 Tax=Aspergillus sclerotiicarbonarius (strain CBS 121057 / IBT 28362) TaxID=1448318 RepID=A0A319E374_ASPSB|nr:hypothetical protein BO78DRAFT_398973 [Aspergillus sclerotiicarbonarius CBS 121057]
MLIKPDPLTHPSTISLLTHHHTDLQSKTPSSSSSSSSPTPTPTSYVLPLTTLQLDPSITVYTAWNGPNLLGCGALKELSPTEGETKSMRTANAHLRKGVGRAIVQHIMSVSRERGYKWLRLETGSGEGFESARRLYLGLGFGFCEAFGEYLATAGEGNCFMGVEVGK